ncbi:MAG: hypothetical protein GWP08_15100 [Nitrospiraceae bacterium]|nr:hypothetical protein [Nitrospiraceae bacterium]
MMTNRQPPLCLLLVLAGYLYAGGGAFQAVHAQEAAGETPLFCIPTPTGELLKDGNFLKWQKGKLSAWSVKNADAVRPAESEGAGVVVTPSVQSDVDLRSFMPERSLRFLRPGDLLFFQMRVRCPNSGSARLYLRIYNEEKAQVGRDDAAHPGDGEWHTLCVSARYPKSGRAITIGIKASTTHKEPVAVEIANARAYVVPPVP